MFLSPIENCILLKNDGNPISVLKTPNSNSFAPLAIPIALYGDARRCRSIDANDEVSQPSDSRPFLQRIPTRILDVPTSWWFTPTSASCSSQTATLLPAPLTALAPQIQRPSAYRHLFFLSAFSYISHFTSAHSSAVIHGF